MMGITVSHARETFPYPHHWTKFIISMGVTSSRSVRRGTSTLFAWLFVLGILISLAVHLGLYVKARGIRMPGFSPENYDTIVPRTFRMKRVEIDSKTLENPVPTPTPRPVERPSSLPEERPVAEGKWQQQEDFQNGNSKGKSTPQDLLPQAMEETIITDPGTRASGLDLLPNPSASARSSSTIPSARLPSALTNLAEPMDLSGGGGTEGGKTSAVPGFSSLEDLLNGTKPLTAETPPILMPTDLLFGYDSDALRPEAAESLSKLGTIIRNARTSTFRIEGHTDSFGTDTYNDALSLRRAEAVKAWLVTTMGIPGERISTAGLGKSHPLVSVTGSIPEQQLNRRVEIVISKD